MSHYIEEEEVRQKLSAAVQCVRTVLHQNREPQLAGDVHHQYEDKYVLADFLTRGAVGALLNTLEALGLKEAGLREMKEWSRERTVHLELQREERCKFDKKTSREVEGKTKHVTQVAGVKVEQKTVTTVVEYHWDVSVGWELCAYGGVAADKRVTLRRREEGTVKVTTTTEAPPHPAVAAKEGIQCDVTWVLRALDEKMRVWFAVDRGDAGCHTPRRNKDVEAAVGCLTKVAQWCMSVKSYLANHVFPIELAGRRDTLDTGSLEQVGSVFVPVVPLLEAVAKNEAAREQRLLEGGGGEEVEESEKTSKDHLAVVASAGEGESSGSSTPLPLRDLEAFLEEERRSLKGKLEAVRKALPSGEGREGLVTAAEGELVAAVCHLREVGERYLLGVDYIEGLLRKQLVGAVGKVLSSEDFGAYMRFHNRKLFKDGVAPRGFSYAVRRGVHNPEGVVALEAGGEPVPTLVRRLGAAAGGMHFALNASTTVSFGGERYVHAYVGHRFSTEVVAPLELTARVRQFSGYVMLLGRIGGSDLFLPEHAVLLQNKDELCIPLLLEEIPTPQAFEDAIESLSPEQQRFAKAYRSMQLEATLFAVCIVQIKPQLERVLDLPPDSLTKEIQLTQDLLELFVEYQIPSDLLAFKADPMEDPDDIPISVKLEQVRDQVAAVKEMLKKAKEEEIENERLVAHKKILEEERRLMDLDMECYSKDAVVFKKKAKGGRAKCSSAVQFTSLATPAPAPEPVQAPDTSKQEVEAVKEPTVNEPRHHDPSPRSGKDYDISALPDVLEERYKQFDEDNCLRPTIVKLGGEWRKTWQKNILTKPETVTVGAEGQKKAQHKAFDLLDALTKSGALGIEEAEMHVVVAATHCFDMTLMDTVVRGSVNPVEKVERSALILASAVHDVHPKALVKGDQLQRVATYSQKLLA